MIRQAVLSLADVTKSDVNFFLQMTIDELADWVKAVNEYLREKAEAMKKR